MSALFGRYAMIFIDFSFIFIDFNGYQIIEIGDLGVPYHGFSMIFQKYPRLPTSLTLRIFRI